MALTLTIDEPRWSTHMLRVVERNPGIVPVVKGNGYGFGVAALAARAVDLGADTLAVGTPEEIEVARYAFDGDVMVLTPWSRRVPDTPEDTRVIWTIARLDDLAAIAQRGGRPRVVLEGLTSMRRHGLTLEQVAGADCSGVTLEGVSLHLPPVGERRPQLESWLEPGLARRVFVSALSSAERSWAGAAHPDVELRPRIGTALWLGDRGALSVTATVLDVHRLARGERAGYRQRRAPRDGHLVVMAGGTTQGIGLKAPTMARTVPRRGAALVKGVLDAAGLALSPYRIAGRRRWFLETPHMQTSLVFLPASVPPPAVGDEVSAEVRFTTTTFDRVITAGTPRRA